MMRKTIMRIVGIVSVASMVLTGCGGSKAEVASSGAETSGELADSINVLVYPDYISEDMLQAFGEEYGIAVNITYCNSESEIMTKLEAGDDYDLIQPAQATVHQLFLEDLVQKINKDQIPNLSNIKKEYDIYDYPEESDYQVPYMSGSASILVDKDACPIEITKWDDLVSPELEGEISATGIDRLLIARVLAAKGLDPNTENQEDLDAVYDWLCAFDSNVKVYDGGAPRTAVENGECSVAYTYTSDAVLALMEEPDANYELASLSDCIYNCNTQMLAIPAATKKVKEAEMLINWIHDGENYANNVMTYPGIPVNGAIDEYLTDDFKKLLVQFDVPSGAKTFKIEAISSEGLEKYDLIIAKVLAN